MSRAESGQRTTHVGLITQQRRLRHLRSLSARNIIVERSTTDKDALMETYFTLHLTPTSEEFYKSEKIQDSLNPTWRSFDLQQSDTSVDSSRSCFIVRVWGGRTEDYRLIIEWKVNLKGLCYLGERIHKDGLVYQPNTIIFGMFEGFYSSPDNITDTNDGVGNNFKEFIEVEQNSAIMCYGIYSLGRLHTTQRAICQTKLSESKVRCAIMEKLKKAEVRTKQVSCKESLLLKVGLLKDEFKQRQQLLDAETTLCNKEKAKVQSTDEEIREKMENLKKDHNQLREDKQRLHEQREQSRNLHHEFGHRRTTLISELSDIYPIVLVGKNNEHAILGIKLPNAENYSGSDDTATATALGHTCHLILMIARFLQLPLRYPMVHCGSRSIVKDHITEQLAERDRDFPLFSRGKERFQFNYAVYLLNRNIAQLRYALGLPTTDLRMTLPNLKSLLETKWGVKSSSSGLQIEPARPNPHQPSSPSGTTPQTVPPLKSSPSQYSNASSVSVGSEVTAEIPQTNIPFSPPPPYQIEQSATASADNVSGPTSLAASADTRNRVLQPTLLYGEDPSPDPSSGAEDDDDNKLLSSSPMLDNHGGVGAHIEHGSNFKDTEQSVTNVDINRTSPSVHSEGRPSGDMAISDNENKSSNESNPNRTGDQSHDSQNPVISGDQSHDTQNLIRSGDQSHDSQNPIRSGDQSCDTQNPVPAALRRKINTSNIPPDANNHRHDPLSQNVEGALSNANPLVSNENHHNNNSHVQNVEIENSTTIALSKEDSVSSSKMAKEESVSSSKMSNQSASTITQKTNGTETTNKSQERKAVSTEDLVEAQKIMDSLGAIDGMFQFDELGSRTEALRDHGDSFSSFRKPSQSGGS